MKNNFNKKRENASKIDDLLERYIDDQNWNNKLLEVEAIQLYNSIKKKDIVENSKARSVKNRELYITVTTPIFANQLSFKQMDIVNWINKKLGQKVITNLKYLVGSVDRDDDSFLDESDPIEDVELNDTEKNNIDDLLNSVEDEEVKNSLKHFLSSATKYNKREKDGEST